MHTKSTQDPIKIITEAPSWRRNRRIHNERLKANVGHFQYSNSTDQRLTNLQIKNTQNKSKSKTLKCSPRRASSLS